MKKLNFTLGLALSMLILGASVMNAQLTAPTPGFLTNKRAGGIIISATLHGCNFYAGPVTISSECYDPTYTVTSWKLDASGGIIMDVNGNPEPATWLGLSPGAAVLLYFNPPKLNNDDATYYLAQDKNIWNFGGWSWDESLKRYKPFGDRDLFYLQKVNGMATSFISINLAYVVGNELRPVVTRTITFGEWYTVDKDTLGGFRSANYAPNPPSALHESIRKFHPIEDRADDIITFIYEDDILELMQKYVIYEIHYDISVHQEYGTPGQNVYDTPTATDVKTQYGLNFFLQDGIKTSPVFYEDQTVFWPSQEDYVFTVISPSMPTVTTNPTRMDNWRQPILPIVKDNLDGTYTVTITHVNKAMKVYIAVENEVEPESGVTGNAAIAADAVWAAGGTLFVDAANPATLSIYTVTGQLYKQTTVSGSSSLALPKGLYIVQLNGKAYKIII